MIKAKFQQRYGGVLYYKHDTMDVSREKGNELVHLGLAYREKPRIRRKIIPVETVQEVRKDDS